MIESEASRELRLFESDLNTSQLQWETFIASLGSAYNDAYTHHTQTLDRMKEKKRAEAEAMYWVLSVVSIGFSGGFAGGLMAPWIANAGKKAASSVAKAALEGFKDTVKEATKQTVKDMLVNADARLKVIASSDVYRPASKNPFTYHIDMKVEFGLAFSALRDTTEGLRKELDAIGAPKAVGTMLRAILSAHTLIKDFPRTKDMPDRPSVSRACEMGMWIAWANVRDMQYWNQRVKSVVAVDYNDVTIEGLQDMRYLIELWENDPVLKRIEIIHPRAYSLVKRYYKMRGKDAGLTESMNANAGQGRKLDGYVLDVGTLQRMGQFLGGVIENVADALKAPQKVLTGLANQKPIWI